MLFIHHLEGMGAKAMHVAVPIWDASVRECDHCLVGCLWSQGYKIPEHICILQN
jgi:hypothetical protein